MNLIILISTLIGAGSATAADALVFGGDGDTRFQAEATKPNDSNTKGTLFNETNVSGYLDYGDWASLNAAAKLEHQRFNNLNDYFPEASTALNSEGLTLRRLYASVYPVRGVSVYGGKIHPRFGTAFDATPGIFYNFGTDYEQDERIGAGVEARLPEWMGRAKLSAETFFLDTTVLSNSAFTRPTFDDVHADRAKKFGRSDGGASNTGDLRSVTVALAGSQPPGLGQLKYQLSFTREGVAQEGERPESGGAAMLGTTLKLTSRIELEPYVEYAHFTNFGGEDGLTRDYAIVGAAANYGRWTLATASGFRHSRETEATPGRWDKQFNLSLIYEFRDFRGLSVGGGVNRIYLDQRVSNTAAAMTKYEFLF